LTAPELIVLFVKAIGDVKEPITVDASSVAVVPPVQAPVVVFHATVQLVTVNFRALLVTLPAPSVMRV